MSEHIMNVLWLISIIFLIYYLSSYFIYKYIKKDIRFLNTNIIDYILNTDKIMKGDK